MDGDRSAVWLDTRSAEEIAKAPLPGARPIAVEVTKGGKDAILESRWEAAGKPLEGWIWSAPTRSGHVESSSLRKQHQNALRTSKVRPFVLYSLRHTFLTRLAESGCDIWTLSRIAGHASLTMSQRYIHPSQDAVLDAIARLGGHKIGHNEKVALLQPVATIAGSTVQ